MCCVESDALHKRLGLLAHSQTIKNKSFLLAPLCLVVTGVLAWAHFPQLCDLISIITHAQTCRQPHFIDIC